MNGFFCGKLIEKRLPAALVLPLMASLFVPACQAQGDSSQPSLRPPAVSEPSAVLRPSLPVQSGASSAQGSNPVAKPVAGSAATIPITGAVSARPANSVDSFFQISPAAAPAGNPVLAAESTRLQKRGSSSHGLMWHVLDAIGVPLPLKDRDGLDPSLRANYVSSVPTQADSNSNVNKVNPSQCNPQEPLHKIPASELEGTIYDQTPNPKPVE